MLLALSRTLANTLIDRSTWRWNGKKDRLQTVQLKKCLVPLRSACEKMARPVGPPETEHGAATFGSDGNRNLEPSLKMT
jgi:hypothetical protein